MLINLTMSEFCQLQKGDAIIINATANPETAIVEDYAFYNSDASEPGWEIETNCGYIAIDSAYKEILPHNTEDVELISLDQFQQLKPGSIIFVPDNKAYIPAVVSCKPFKSHSLENILGAGEDWEVETNLGFIHNDSAYVEKIC